MDWLCLLFYHHLNRHGNSFIHGVSMTKEYTGPEFEIEFHERYLEWLKAGKVGVDPRTQWQTRPGGEWTNGYHGTFPSIGLLQSYRWKPAPKRMVTIGYSANGFPTISKTIVAPEVEAPSIGTVFYRHKDPHHIQHWCGGGQDLLDLNNGEVFFTREDAQAMAEWLAVCRRGGAV